MPEQQNSSPESGNEKPLDESAKNYIHQLLKDGKELPFIAETLEKNGYNKNQAAVYAATVKLAILEEQGRRTKKWAPVNLILGLVILGAGIAITFSEAGIIAYGAIIVGAAKTLQGIAGFIK